MTAAPGFRRSSGREPAIQALGALGAAAAPAVPALAALLEEEPLPVSKALRAIGPPAAGALPDLIAWIDRHGHTPYAPRVGPRSDPDSGVHGEVIAALDRIDRGWPQSEVARAVVEAHVRRLQSSPGWRARESEALSLGTLGPMAVPAVPVLVEHLGDEHPAVRRATARALGNLGPAAKSALPALRRHLDREPQEEVARTVSEALRSIDRR